MRLLSGSCSGSCYILCHVARTHTARCPCAGSGRHHWCWSELKCVHWHVHFGLDCDPSLIATSALISCLLAAFDTSTLVPYLLRLSSWFCLPSSETFMDIPYSRLTPRFVFLYFVIGWKKSHLVKFGQFTIRCRSSHSVHRRVAVSTENLQMMVGEWFTTKIITNECWLDGSLHVALQGVLQHSTAFFHTCVGRWTVLTAVFQSHPSYWQFKLRCTDWRLVVTLKDDMPVVENFGVFRPRLQQAAARMRKRASCPSWSQQMRSLVALLIMKQ